VLGRVERRGEVTVVVVAVVAVEAVAVEDGGSVSKVTDLGRGAVGRAGETAGATEGVAVMAGVVGEFPLP
jgi:hypothetical protein